MLRFKEIQNKVNILGLILGFGLSLPYFPQSWSLPINQAPADWLKTLQSKGSSYRPRTVHLEADGKPKYINRLIFETSPYLLQHAHNPVNWFAWGAEALLKAQKEDKPILLSIGYSTCHWCHVMERESFEDEEIARYINEYYIPIKVDREERPDLDDVYMKAVQLLTGRGGWPMTTLLTPQQIPFFGGTYFPPRDGYRGRRRGFLGILKEYQNRYRNQRKALLANAQELSRRINQDSQRQPHHLIPKVSVVAKAAQRLARRFDSVWGGFGRSPKFPTPPNLELLLKYFKRVGDDQALSMLSHTLRQMARGGIYDHLGGGFHRYSTDQRWRVPHFEKMLYDNAQLASIYLQTAAITSHHEDAQLFRQIAKETLDYLNREMCSPEQLYYSATDADSLAPNGEHPEEGLFFMWTPKRLSELLTTNEFKMIQQVYQITKKGDLDGQNILHRKASLNDLSKMSGLSTSAFEQRLKKAKSKLYTARLKRQAPLRDDKVITSWNALVITAMVHGARYLDRKYLEFARRTAHQLLQKVMNSKGQLKRTFMDKKARHFGVLDDYAFTIQALIDLFEVSGEAHWLKQAILLQDYLDKHFWASQKGGYYMTDDQAEQLISRDQPSYDGAEPSGNSIAAHNLLRLHKLTERPKYLKKLESLLKTFAQKLERFGGLNQMMTALLDYHGKGRELAIVLPQTENFDHPLLKAVLQGVWPNTAIVIKQNPSDQVTILEHLIPWIKDKPALNNQATAYLCYEGICERPMTSSDQLISSLEKEPLLYQDRSPEPL